MKQGRVERSKTIDPPPSEQEPGPVTSTEASLTPNSNKVLVSSEAGASAAGSTFPAVSLTSTATSSPPSSTGRVSPPPVSTQSQTQVPATIAPNLPAQSSHEPGPSVGVPPSSSMSPPVMQASSQLPTGSVSSVPGVSSSNTGSVPPSEQQPFNSIVSSSQPINSSIHAPQHTNSQSQPLPISTPPPPPSSVPSQSLVQSQPAESEGTEVQTKAVGRDDIQALDKKLRSLFKDQSTTSSSASLDPSQNTGTSSPPTGTSSPPPGLALVPPSNLPLSSGVQGVLGPITTPGQGIASAGHAQTPPTKPRAQVSEKYRIQKNSCLFFLS